MSYKSLTSFEAQKKLSDLKVEDPAFWNELSAETVASDLPTSNEIIPEDTMDQGDHNKYGDDSSIGLATVVKAVVDKHVAVLKTVGIWKDGSLVQEMLAEDNNEEPGDLIDGMDQTVVNKVHNSHAQMHAHTNVTIGNLPEEQGHGRRIKISNKQFANFICHDDNEHSDVEV